MRLKNYLNEEQKKVPITSMKELYNNLFTKGVLDPNKILDYAPYVKVDESKIKNSIRKLHKETTNLTLSDLYKELKKYGKVYNDIFGDRLAYTVVINNTEDVDQLYNFFNKHQLDTFNRNEKFAKNYGETSVKAWENLLLNDFVTLLLKDEYSEIGRQPIVDIEEIDSRTIIPEFLEYINKNKRREVKVVKE